MLIWLVSLHKHVFPHLCLTSILQQTPFFFRNIVRTHHCYSTTLPARLSVNTVVFPLHVRKCVHTRACFSTALSAEKSAYTGVYTQHFRLTFRKRLDFHQKSAGVFAHAGAFPHPQTPHFAHNSFRAIVCQTTVHVQNSVSTNTSTANVVVCPAGPPYSATVQAYARRICPQVQQQYQKHVCGCVLHKPSFHENWLDSCLRRSYISPHVTNPSSSNFCSVLKITVRGTWPASRLSAWSDRTHLNMLEKVRLFSPTTVGRNTSFHTNTRRKRDSAQARNLWKISALPTREVWRSFGFEEKCMWKNSSGKTKWLWKQEPAYRQTHPVHHGILSIKKVLC